MKRWEAVAHLERAGGWMTPGRRIRLNMLRRNGFGKLDEERVAAIKAELGHPGNYHRDREIAEREGVKVATIQAMRSGRTWAHVPWPDEGGDAA